MTPELASPDAAIAITGIFLALLLAGVLIGICRILDEHHREPRGEEPEDAAATLARIDHALDTLHDDGWRL